MAIYRGRMLCSFFAFLQDTLVTFCQFERNLMASIREMLVSTPFVCPRIALLSFFDGKEQLNNAFLRGCVKYIISPRYEAAVVPAEGIT